VSLLFYLFSAHNWSARDLRDLYEREDGWQDLIRAFALHECDLRDER